MGKRELLLLSGSVVIGLLIYQLTMPATADTGGRVSASWAKVRSHVAQNWVEQHYERKDEVKVPAAIRTVSVELDRASVTILGEARDTLAVDLCSSSAATKRWPRRWRRRLRSALPRTGR